MSGIATLRAPQTERPLRSVDELVAAGLVVPDAVASLRPVEERYSISLSGAMRAAMAAGGPDGPVGRQFIPSARELETDPLERADPIGDDAHSPMFGLVHRYPDRVLLKLVSVCPVYCRFCFRREMVGPDGDGAMSEAQIAAAVDYVRAHPEITEVILTGGDPFMLSARRVRALMALLDTVPQLAVIRWHTRVPVVDPERVTDDFVAALADTDKTVVVAVHANHADEFGAAAVERIKALRKAGVLLVSQTVLLKGINDSVVTLEQLMRRFLGLGILPYYLHHGDLANGTAHFRTTLAEGLDLVEALRGKLSGLAQPTYVLDLPGGDGKVPVTRALIRDGGARTWTGAWHAYPPRAE